ncbi:MAG: sigma-70 family RNA polymerase sigma factor [Anaerolineae bacterium]|nr:sigma-70 family RNA polymerase sigma factor [Anaerolineae bacterium]
MKRSDNFTHDPAGGVTGDSAGDSAGRFQTVYTAYLPRLYGYVAARVDDAAEAEDLVSEIFLKAVKHFDQLQAADALTTWLFTIARRTVADHYRRRRLPAVPYDALEDAPADDPLPDVVLARAENAAHIRQLVRTLPPRRQEVLVLRFFAGLRNHEIARVLELDEHTVASHLARGLKDLYARYQASEVEEREDADGTR